jgi:transposase-like protein
MTAKRYDTETKARALALLREGKPVYLVAREIGVGERTVCTWAKRFESAALVAGERGLIDEEYRIAGRAQELIHEALDQIEEQGDAAKYLGALNAVRGTMVDKLLAREANRKGYSGTNNIFILQAAQRLGIAAPPDIGDDIEVVARPDERK